MFVRVKTSRNSPKSAIQIVESIRNGKTVKQRIVRHVGTAYNDKEIDDLKNLAEHIKARMEDETQPNIFNPDELADTIIAARKKVDSEKPLPVNLRNLREEQRVITGIHEVFSSIYSEIGLDTIITSRHYAARRDLRHIVMARIANPTSKRQSVIDLTQNFGVEISLDSVYRMMDTVNEVAIDKVNKCAVETARSLLKEDINVAFYDCTTLYFESFTESDELLKNGYSKDLKFNQPQIILALLTTVSGLPIGYKLYPGNTFEGNTLCDAIKTLREEYSVKRVVFVADSAMLSKDNLAKLEEQQIEYVVGARLRSLPVIKQDEIFNESGWVDTYCNEETDESERYKELQIQNDRRLIVTYRSSRAKKDKADREKTLQKLVSRIKKSKDPASLISNFGYRKFIKTTGDATIEIDEDKVSSICKWDGMHGIVSNVKDMSASELRAHYKSLWEIEECFRISKTDLKFRPVFHWTEKRVRAHIAICFMSLLCVRYLQYQLKVQGHNYSIQSITRELNSIQTSVVKDIKTNRKYAIPSAVSEIAHIIFKHCSIKLDQVPYELN